MVRRRKKSTRRSTPKKDWRPAFLEALAEPGSVVHAATKAKIHRSTAYNARADERAFADAWKEAEQIGVELMEAEARRRAVEGCRRPVYQGGKLVGHVQEYSDTLLIFLLKAHKPEKYRERHQVEHSGGTTQTVIYLPQKNAPPV